jgi:hypothetical protein
LRTSAAQRAGPGGGFGAGLFDQREQARGVAVERLEQQRFLALEVVIQAGLGRAAGLGQLRHRGAGIADPRERLDGVVQDQVALMVVACGARTRHRAALPQRSS